MFQDPLELEGVADIPESKWDTIVGGAEIRPGPNRERSGEFVRAMPEIEESVSSRTMSQVFGLSSVCSLNLGFGFRCFSDLKSNYLPEMPDLRNCSELRVL